MPEPGPILHPLQAGPWRMSFDGNTGFLRRLMVGNHEVVRAIYGAVRDAHWGTIHPVLSNFRKSEGESNFELSFEALCERKEIHFDWQGTLTGNEDGELCFQFQGVARSDFQSNRIGLCVLHPLAECVGRECILTRPDGTTTAARFPGWIAPHQPFKQIRKMRYEIAEQRSVEIHFEGEVFETEDQRNWTDGSFKTYGTPLELPFPSAIHAGQSVSQKITVNYCGSKRHFIMPSLTDGAAQVVLSRTGKQVSKPDLGVELKGNILPEEKSFLEILRLGHLRVELHFQNSNWLVQLEEASRLSMDLRVPLHLALFFSNEISLESNALLAILDRLKCDVSLFLVYSELDVVTPTSLLLQIQEKFVLFKSARFAAGTMANFSELNRDRNSAAMARPCYSINPQVHIEDDLSLMENLEAQAATVETAASFSKLGVAVSPVTLKPRTNVYRTAVGDKSDSHGKSVDPRQTTEFCAAWTFGSIVALASTNKVGSITYYEFEGDEGIMKRNFQDAASPQLFPVFHLFHQLARVDGFELLASSHPLSAQGLSCFIDGHESHILMANLRSDTQEILLNVEHKVQKVTFLDGTNRQLPFQEIGRDISISFPAYALVRIDFSI